MHNKWLKLLENVTVEEHSLRPLMFAYNVIGMTGEAGEVANNIKKLIMLDINPSWIGENSNGLPNEDDFKSKVKDELSDVLFYLTRLAKDFGTTLDDLAFHQVEKINKQSHRYGRKFKK